MDWSLGLQEVEAPRISRQSAHKCGKLVSRTHRPPLPPRRYPRYSFVLRLSRPKGHSEAGKIKWMQNSTYPIGNRARDHPACGAVPQSNMPPRCHICFHLEVSHSGIVEDSSRCNAVCMGQYTVGKCSITYGGSHLRRLEPSRCDQNCTIFTCLCTCDCRVLHSFPRSRPSNNNMVSIDRFYTTWYWYEGFGIGMDSA